MAGEVPEGHRCRAHKEGRRARIAYRMQMPVAYEIYIGHGQSHRSVGGQRHGQVINALDEPPMHSLRSLLPFIPWLEF